MAPTLVSKVLDFIDDGVAIFSVDWSLSYSNQAFKRITGYSYSENPDALLVMMRGPETDPATFIAIEEAMQAGSPFRGQVVWQRKCGELFWSDFSIQPEFDENGAVDHFIAKFRDISARKAIETKAARLERDYRFIFDNIQSAVTVHSPDGQIRLANPSAIALLGIEAESLEGSTPADKQFSLVREDGSPMPLDEYPVIRAIHERVAIRGAVLGYDRELDHKRLWFVCNAFPVIDGLGEAREVVLSFSDITPLIESEAQAHALQQRFELAARAAQDAIFEWNIESGDFWANEAYKTVYGYDPPERILLDALETTSAVEADHDMVRQVTLEAIESGKERYLVDYDIVRPDGSKGHVAVRAFIVRDAAGIAKKIIGTGTDVGQLSRATRALEQSETRFRLIADSASDVLWDHDFETNQTWSSADWPSKLGIDCDPSIANNFKWVPIVDPADRPRLIKSFQDAIKSNATFWEVEFRARGKDNQPIDIAVRASVLRHSNGRASRILGNMRNLTHEKRHQEGYTRARALEAVGQLTGGVAHDFNNLLMIIQGNAELLELSDLGSEEAESVAMINQAAQSAANITRRLLTFARQTKLNTTRVDIRALVGNTIALLRTGLPETIGLRHDICNDIWSPEVDANGLEQAIVNLAMNSNEAMPNGGEIVVKCENFDLAPDMTPPAADLMPGRYVLLSVSDNGEGMSKQVLARAFEPFFTTKDIGKGTGLGLSTVFGFASQSGGAVTINSEEGYGTCVSIYLPAGSDFADLPGDADLKGEDSQQRPSWRILVVEDQPQVRRHVEKTLTRFGHNVTSAEDARKALELFEKGETFDLLFTDIVMPGGMNGQELAEIAKRICPRLEVLFTSGYPAAAFEHVGLRQQGAINLLHKPYRAAELLEAIEKTMSGH